MIQVEEVVNNVFSSKTYILYKEGENKAWLVDIGDIEPVEAFMEKLQLSAEGVFLTHGHFDHIYGLCDLMDLYPHCVIYSTDYTKRALASSKLNLSRYHDTPFEYDCDNVNVVCEGKDAVLFKEEPPMLFLETPGHNPGCLTMIVGDRVFTGDAYIPGVGTNTQLPYSDKEKAKLSVERILQASIGKKILSGHKTAS